MNIEVNFSPSERSAAAFDELAPAGVVRVGVVQAPHPGVYFVKWDGSGRPQGVTADLGEALAAGIGAPATFEVFPNSGECTAALQAHRCDVAFMPVDAHRQELVAFGPAIFDVESTYLIAPGLALRSAAQLDRPEMRVIGIEGTTTLRACWRSLRHVRAEGVRSVEHAIELLQRGKADALALSRDALRQLVPEVPGSTVLDGGFFHTSIAIAVPRDRPHALDGASAFLRAAKANGLVRSIFDAHGLQAEAVAP